jgi:glycosidase
LRIYEINTRAFCDRFDLIGQDQLTRLAALGMDAVWLMGVWRISEGAKKISKTISADFEGSPYAIADYAFSPELGGLDAYTKFRQRATAAGLRVLVDFIPNHMALDNDWISENAELFIRSNSAARKQDPSEFFLHCSGEVIAHGKDPYFPPWYDTAQLDYTSAALRARQIDVLKWIAKLADGVRCDMAMLVLRDYFGQRWYPGAPQGWFNQHMPAEFWGDAVAAVKQQRPDFTFIAEAYWGKEPDLQHLGFDLTYEKTLYDGLVERRASRIMERLRQPAQSLKSSLFFIENHDESRAAAVFDTAENLAAMALILSLPGSVLIHEGQMQGLRRKLPVQMRRPADQEPPDLGLESAYEWLLRVTADPIFREGEFVVFSSGGSDLVSFARVHSGRVVAYFGQIGNSAHNFATTALNLTPLAEMVGASSALKLTDLVTGNSYVVANNRNMFAFVPGSIGLWQGGRFCLVQASPA